MSFLRRQAASILACDFLTVDTVFLQLIAGRRQLVRVLHVIPQ